MVNLTGSSNSSPAESPNMASPSPSSQHFVITEQFDKQKPPLAGTADLIGKSWSESVHPIPPVRPFEESAGPVHQLPQDATPVDFFSLFWEPPFFQTLAEETNRYATQRQVQKPDRKWYPTTPEEIRAFIGINIIMGIDQKPAISHYWSTDPYLGNPGIQSVMPRERFEALYRYLHLSNSDEMPGRDDPAYDPLYKIRPLINLCQQNFRDRYVPGQNMCVDEGMIKYKGRLYFRQYMPKKPRQDTFLTMRSAWGSQFPVAEVKLGWPPMLSWI